MTPSPSGDRASLLHRAPPEFLFILSAAAQYSGAVVAVDLFDRASPVLVAWVRVLAAGAILTVFSVRRMRSSPWTRRDLLWAGCFGVTTGLMNTFFYLAIERLPLGKGVTIEFIGPITVAALRTKSLRNSLALSLAAGGVVVLGGVELGNEPLGLLCIVLASLAWAGYIVLGSRVAMADRGVGGLGVGLLIGAVALAPTGIAALPGTVDPAPVLLLAALVGLLSSAVGYGIDQSVMRRIPVRRFSVMLALLPVTAAVFGFLFLGQSPTAVDLAGMALVLAGVALQERDERERHPQEAETP